VYPAQNKAVQPSKGQYGHVTDVAKLHPPARVKKAFSTFNFQFSTLHFIGGYMPLQRQAGFIYDLPNNELIAHELAHGAFNLRHTFSEDAFVAAQSSTDNLMDYKGNTELWHHQWKKIQNPERVWMAFAEEEEEGEGIYEDDFEKALSTSANIIAQANFGRSDRNKNDNYDKEFWETGRCIESHDAVTITKEKSLWLSLKDGKEPSSGVLSIIKNPQKWSFDCAEYVQVIIWSTILNVNGKEKFDEYINSLLHENAIACIERYFTLLPHNSTGIIQEKKYSRYSDPDEEFMDESSFMFIETSENELLQQVPIGTRIAVKNVRAPENSAYRYENAIKLTKFFIWRSWIGDTKVIFIGNKGQIGYDDLFV
jgi:hypothetical protein